jgi:hypothetical protein
MNRPALVILALAALSLSCLGGAASAATFEQLTPGDGIASIQFQHLAMNDAGQFVAVSNSQVYVGQAGAGTLTRVLSNERLGFVLEDASTMSANDQTIRLDLAMLGTRLAINGRGDYVVASHTMLFVGSASGGEPRKVYEEANAMLQTVAINDQGHYVALTRRGVIAGQAADAAAVKLVADAPGSFEAFDVLGTNGNWAAEVGQSRLALNDRGQFVAASGRAIYGGSVADHTAAKIYENAKVGFRQVRLSSDGTFTAVSSRNVYRGKL